MVAIDDTNARGSLHGVTPVAFDRELMDRGVRITAARAAVLRAIERHGEPFSPEEIVPEAGVGRATVYRTLRVLADQGLICRVTGRDGLDHRYHISLSAHEQHLICAACGAIEEIEQPDIDEAVQALLARLGFSLMTLKVEAYGTCNRCGTDRK